jgi:signal transduction histidine kinase
VTVFVLAFPGNGHAVAVDAAVGAGLVAALLIRRIWPSLALPMVAGLPASSIAAVFVVPMLAYGAGGRISSTRRKVGVLALGSVVGMAASLLFDMNGRPWQLGLLLAAVSVIVLLLPPAAIGVIAAERRSRTRALEERNAVLEQAHRLGRTQARLQERARIAGEMHDVLGHRLSLIALCAGALEVRSQDGTSDLSKEASLVRTTAKTALDELREVLGILRVDARPRDTEGPDDDSGTRADIAGLVEASRRAGLQVELRWSGDDLAGADARVRRAVHRVVREALTNAHKHAPGSQTQVGVERDATQVRVKVSSGVGGPAAPRAPGTGLGLVGLEERVRLAGGTFSAGPRDGARFVVRARLPVVAPAFSAAASAEGSAEGAAGVSVRGWAGGPVADGRVAEGRCRYQRSPSPSRAKRPRWTGCSLSWPPRTLRCPRRVVA